MKKVNPTPKQKGQQKKSKPASRAVRNMAYGSIQRAVSAPVSMASTVRNLQPKIAYNGSNSCCIMHRELIATINHSSAFTTTSFALNPGLSATFPWLAPMAAQWEQYRFKKLIFNYVTRTSTTTVGSVLLAPDYDASDSAPTSEVNMASYQDCVEDVPWKNLVCRMNAASMHVIQQRKYLRTGSIPAGTDVKLYDVGNFFVGTTGGVNTDPIGKLYVEYEVEFFVPQKESATSSGSSFAYTGSNITSTGTFDTLCQTATAIIAAPSAPALGQFTVPRGNWAIFVQLEVNSTGIYTFRLLVDGTALTSQQRATYANGGTDLVVLTYTAVLSLTASAEVKVQVSGSGGVVYSKQMLLFSALC